MLHPTLSVRRITMLKVSGPYHKTEALKEHGLKLGEQQTILLQKIEELTLYIIEQQKQINELKQQLKQ